jgi:hypothetical protein
MTVMPVMARLKVPKSKYQALTPFMLPRESRLAVTFVGCSLCDGTQRQSFERTICMQAGTAGKGMHPSMHDAMNYSILWISMGRTILSDIVVGRSAIEAKNR